jgi:hypothetical protein
VAVAVDIMALVELLVVLVVAVADMEEIIVMLMQLEYNLHKILHFHLIQILINMEIMVEHLVIVTQEMRVGAVVLRL